MTATDVRAVTPRVAFKAPGAQVNGLEAVAEGLWLSDQLENRTYLIDYHGTVRTSFISPARNASGTTFGAGSVWVASNVNPSMVFRHDPGSGECLAFLMLPHFERGGVHGVQWRPYELGVQPPPPPAPTARRHNTAGGARNGGPGVSGTLWVTRPGTNEINHIDAETGELLSQIPFPVIRSHGLFWDETDDTLSVVESNGGHVYRLRPQDGEVLDEWRVDGVEAHAMTRSADGRIWFGDAATNLISVVEP